MTSTQKTSRGFLLYKIRIGSYGLAIGNSSLRDYCFLLNFLSESRIDNFNSFNGVSSNITQILNNIKKEVMKTEPSECRLGISRRDALKHLVQIKRAVKAVFEVVCKCAAKGYDPDEYVANLLRSGKEYLNI